MHPTLGVSTGGTKVRLQTSTLADVLRKLDALDVQAKPMCRFDNVTTPATVVQSDGLECISPPMPTNIHSTKAASVSVSLNGEDFVSTHQHFHYYSPPVIHSISPESVWIQEPTEIVIRGSNFLSLDPRCCIVGEEIILAEVTSSSEIRCKILVNQTYSNQIIPVAVSLNGGNDVSNIIPIYFRVKSPMITSANPLFASDSGGTTVELKGYGFEQIKTGGLIKLAGSNAIAKLFVTDDETAFFNAPSSDGYASSTIWLSYGYGYDRFVDSGFELHYLPDMHISGVHPSFVIINKETPVEVSGKFDKRGSYSCVLLEEDSSDPIELSAEYLDETTLACDVLVSHNRTLSLSVRREDDGHVSNVLKISPTPQYALESIVPSVISEAGGQLLTVISPKEFSFDIPNPLDCKFTDELGTISTVRADIIAANEVRCVAPPLVERADLCLTSWDGVSQSNHLDLSVVPMSQVLRLIPDSGPLFGGTNIIVEGMGFDAYWQAKILCSFSNETSRAEIIDDEAISCTTPSFSSDEMGGNVTFSLVQAEGSTVSPISNSKPFLYYVPPKLDLCVPDNGPASGGAEIKLHGEAYSEASDFKVSFTLTADPNRVAYSEEVMFISESILAVTTPPSPTGSKGGIVAIQLSQNGQDFSTPGIYYNYTGSTFVHSFHPHQVMTKSCFNLTLIVENMFSSPRQCLIGNQKYPASQGLIADTVICNICLDIHQGYHRVGLLTDNNILTQSSSELEVRTQINATKMTPRMGPIMGGNIITVEGEDFEAWTSQLYCFFGNTSSPARVLNDTALQCPVPPMKELGIYLSDDNELNTTVYVAPYHQPMMSDIEFSMHYYYYETEVVDSFAPRSGPKEGGTLLEIEGMGFIDTSSLSCKFGNMTARAAFVSSKKIECKSPHLAAVSSTKDAPISTPLTVSNNGRDFEYAGTYIYHGTPEITRISPSVGPSLTEVKLTTKSSLGWVEHLACKFGDILATAYVASDHEIICTSPVQEESESPNVLVQISLNGFDFFGNSQFQYSNQPLVYSMSPTYGPMSGDTVVTVHGKSLDFSSTAKGNLLCKFGTTEAVATWISATKILCIAPPQNHNTVPFSIISKNPNFVLESYHDGNFMQYTFLRPTKILSIHPSYGSVRGDTLLSINVDEVPDIVDHLFCLFGFENEVKATTIATVDSPNNAIVSCRTPPSNISGLVSVNMGIVFPGPPDEIINMSQDQEPEPNVLTYSDAQFRYTAEPLIKAIYPSRGPNVGGTVVSLQGDHFSPSGMDYTADLVNCKFGEQTSPALFVSNEEVKCISPSDSVTREIQAVKVTGNNLSNGLFTLGFKDGMSDPISITTSADVLRENLASLPGMTDIVVSESSLDSTHPVQKAFLITFLGPVYEDQPLIKVEDAGITGDNASIFVERVQSLCCDVTLSLNGVDYHGAGDGQPLMFVYDEKVIVTSVSPSHGSVQGGTDVNMTVSGIGPSHGIEQSDTSLMCVFGDAEVEGHWVPTQSGYLVSCSSPASLWEMKVTVGAKIGDVRAESMTTFIFRHDPIVTSTFPESLPVFEKETEFIEVYGNHFHNSSMVCVLDISLPSKDTEDRRHDVHRLPAIFHNSSYIQCPLLNSSSLQSFFSDVDLSWTTNATLVEGSVLELSLESGGDNSFIGAIPFHAVVETTSLFPQTGPRAGGTEVIVEGENFVNSTHLTCKFGSVVGPFAQYLCPTKVLCTTPHFPLGYGRAIVPVIIAVNGVDFSAEDVLFEFHEPLVIRVATPLVGLPKGGTIVSINLDDSTMRLQAVQDEGTAQTTISYFDPPYGPETGGNLVSIHGSGFTPNHFTLCHFGTATTPAQHVSDESIECVAPKAVDHTRVNLSVSVNGAESFFNDQLYTYLRVI